MNILNNVSYTRTLSSANISKSTKKYKPDFIDKISEKVVNKNDINDMVTVPRTIFKGYLCFTAGTMINSIASRLKKHEGLSKGLGLVGSIIAIYGTFNFVKPFLIRDKNLTSKEK